MRQYIGARYVPKFFENSATGDNTWASGVQYEALTIVKWNGNSYISKKVVPVNIGSPSENPNYWVMDGTTTVTQLINEVNQLESDVGTIEAVLPKKVDKLSNRRFLMIGDSYDTICTPTRWSSIVNTILGLSNTFVLSVGGYGFVTGQNKKWIDLLAETVIANEETITDILIVGGANDAWATAGSIPTAMAAFDTYVKNRFANLDNIYLGFAGNSFLTNVQHNQMITACNYYIDTAKSLGWKYLHGVECTLYNPDFVQSIDDGNDLIHPNTNGVTMLANNIVECILTGSCQNHSGNRTVTFTRDEAFSNTGTFQMTETNIDDYILIESADQGFVPASNIAAGWVKLGTCQILKSGTPSVTLPTTITVGGTVKAGFLQIRNFTDLYVYTYDQLPSGSAVKVVSFSNLCKIG